MKKDLLLGCIADDFTGASDAASFLVAGGLDTVLCSGVPEEGFQLPESCEAVVIALKSRTQETAAAVRDSLASIRWLKGQGAQHFYVKYCSTFDSTPSGNIGPILDAVMDELDANVSTLCPALPENGRIVEDGILYVNGTPLAESPMKDHPLTPMWESRIALLMAPQSRYPCLELPQKLLRGDREELRKTLSTFTATHRRGYIIPDYIDERDAAAIAGIFGDGLVLSGGSGLLTALARHLKPVGQAPLPPSKTPGPALILSGSCSVTTRSQITHYLSHGGRGVRLEDEKLLQGTQTAQSLWMEAESLTGDAPLLYSFETPEGLKAKRTEEGKRLSALIEKTLAGVAKDAAAADVTRFIIAGGETSGAVTRALGFRLFRIGESIAPGVPILIPLEQPKIRMVLKSGNFGQEDFFSRALKMTET